MKQVLGLILFLFCNFFQIQAQLLETPRINWIDFEEAQKLSAQDGKPVFMDVYATWCGPCKRMDQTTFTNPQVIAYVNEHFHAVKFDAERQDTVMYKDTLYIASPIPEGKTKSPHYLAYKLLNGNLMYPTIVFMVDSKNIIAPIPGMQTVETIQPYLFYFGEGVYTLNNLWESFIKGYSAPRFN